MPRKVPAASGTQRSLLSLATVLTGNTFVTAQALFTLLSAREIAKQTVPRIPSGPKSNCYFILSIGEDLIDYEKSSVNKPLIQDKIRDGTGSWNDVNTSNIDFYQVHGKILTSVKLKKNVQPRPHYDLRTHRATYSTKVASNPELSRKSIFWFWNAPLSPAPGFAIVSYLKPA